MTLVNFLLQDGYFTPRMNHFKTERKCMCRSVSDHQGWNSGPLISMDSFRLLSQVLILKVLLGQPLYVLPHIWVVFQIFIERPDDVQPPVVLRLDQASHNLKAPLFQSIHCKGRKPSPQRQTPVTWRDRHHQATKITTPPPKKTNSNEGNQRQNLVPQYSFLIIHFFNFCLVFCPETSSTMQSWLSWNWDPPPSA